MTSPMTIIRFCAILALSTSTACARLPDAYAAKMADAIYRLEGGPRAGVPYGIKSVKVRSAAHARLLCIQTIQNNHDRWLAARRPGHFFDFLANRYCPIASDPKGNANWKRNIHRIMKGQP